MSNPTISQSNAFQVKATKINFSNENIALTKEQMEHISNDVKKYQHIYYNPKAEDKSKLQEKGLHINYELINRSTVIEKLDDEPEHYYNLLMKYLDCRSYKYLIDNTLNMHQVKLNRRQIFYIAKKFDWKTRIEKFDSEVNFEIMSELHGKYINNRRNRLENIMEIYENANNLIDTFHNEITSDLQLLAKYKQFDDDMKLKRTKDVLKIYTDYTKLTEKLEEIIEKENMTKFNPIEDENLENADEIFAEMEKTDQISAIWNKFKSNVNQEMQNYKVENEKIMNNG